MMSLDVEKEFPILKRLIYFNHASLAPLPARSACALQQYAAQSCLQAGAAWAGWDGLMTRTRQRAGQLLGVPGGQIGFVHNTTHGLLCLANSLRWRAGDNIVTAQGEFPGNYYPWAHLQTRGVGVRQVPPREGNRFDPADFVRCMDAQTRVVAISLVSYSTGYRMPVETLAVECAKRHILLVVDAIQGAGAMPARPDQLGCDVWVADGRKWLLGSEGAGLMWVRPQCMGRLDESMTGWVARRPWDFSNLAQPLAPGAQRFEEGAYNIAGLIALGESLGLLLEVGAEVIWKSIEGLTARLEEGLRRQGFTIHSPRGEGERSGIIAASRAGLDSAAAAGLLAERGVQISQRQGWLRFAPHFYNTSEQIERLMSHLQECRA